MLGIAFILIVHEWIYFVLIIPKANDTATFNGRPELHREPQSISRVCNVMAVACYICSVNMDKGGPVDTPIANPL